MPKIPDKTVRFAIRRKTDGAWFVHGGTISGEYTPSYFSLNRPAKLFAWMGHLTQAFNRWLTFHRRKGEKLAIQDYEVVKMKVVEIETQGIGRAEAPWRKSFFPSQAADIQQKQSDKRRGVATCL